MTRDQSNECIRILGQVFPKAELNAEELRVFQNAIERLDRDCVVEAIRSHRLTNDFSRPKFGQLLAAARAAQSKTCTERKTQSWPDIIRRRMKRPELSDYAAILWHYWGEWNVQYRGPQLLSLANTDAERERIEKNRQCISGRCERDLIAAGMVSYDGARPDTGFARRAAESITESRREFVMSVENVEQFAPKTESA